MSPSKMKYVRLNHSCTCIQFPKQSEKGAIWSEYYTKASEESRLYPIDQIKDPMIKLQLMALQDKGSGALPQDKLDHVSNVGRIIISSLTQSPKPLA